MGARRDGSVPGRPLAERLQALRHLTADLAPPDGYLPLTPQQRGFRLEALLRDALHAEGLQPRLPFRPVGEQIDGSFVLDGRVILFEAKWTAGTVPASDLYAFQGKVQGKLAGTVGLFISMSGFSENAADALLRGKELSVLLVTDDDLTVAFSHGSFSAMVRHKLRAAAEEGVALAPYALSTSDAGLRAPSELVLTRTTPVVFCVEGPSDALVVAALGQRVLKEAGSDASITTQVAFGAENAVRLAGSVRDHLGGAALVAVVIDADAEGSAARQLRFGKHAAIRHRQIAVVAVPPTLERAWLGMAKSGPDFSRRLARALPCVDIGELRDREPSFRRFAGLLEAYARSEVRNRSAVAGQ